MAGYRFWKASRGLFNAGSAAAAEHHNRGLSHVIYDDAAVELALDVKFFFDQQSVNDEASKGHFQYCFGRPDNLAR